MTSRSFSRAMLESPPSSGSWMKKPSLGLGLQNGKEKIFNFYIPYGQYDITSICRMNLFLFNVKKT